MIAKTEKDPLIGTRLGDYTIQDVLGRGGMARVYRGLDENLGRPAAVKVLHIPDDSEDERIIDRFRLEARAIAHFEHPNIVAIYQFGESDSQFFIAMKLVDGQTLAQVLRDLRRTGDCLPVERILKTVGDVCSALDYAHARGIIHRDIKPSNILYDRNANNRAILTDFGLAMELGGNNTRGTAFGTPRYIAPEQAVSSQQAVPQSDIYSLGVVVYEMLTGRVPFEDESPMSIALSHITSQPPSPRSFNPAIPAQVEAVLLRALAKEPADRYQTGEEFYKALEAAYVTAEIEMPTMMVQPASLAEAVAPAVAEPVVAAPPTSLPKSKAKPRTRKAKPIAEPAPEPAAQPEEKPVEPAKPAEEPARARRRRLPIGVLILVVLAVAAGALVISGNAGALFHRLFYAGTIDRGAAGIPADARLNLELYYDSASFTLYNDSDYALPLAGLSFVWADGASLDGAAFKGRLPAGYCARVREMSDFARALPRACALPEYAVQMVASPDGLTWAQDGRADTFRVLLDGRELQTCLMADGYCAFTLP